MYLLIKTLYFFFGEKDLYTLRKIGKFFGGLLWYVFYNRRKVAITNARIIGAKNPEECARESFKQTFMSYMEAFCIDKVDQEFIDKYITIKSVGELPDYNKGEIIVSAHYGCWELAAPILSVVSPLKIGLLAKRIKDPKIDKFVKARRNSPETMVYIHHRNCSDIISRMIDDNSHIAALLDHTANKKDAAFIPLFGVKTSFNKGLALIAVRKNVPIRPTFLTRTEKGADLLFHEPLFPDMSLKPKERVYELARRINKSFEDTISSNPEQWYLVHKRFKRIEDENGNVVKGTFY